MKKRFGTSDTNTKSNKEKYGPTKTFHTPDYKENGAPLLQ